MGAWGVKIFQDDVACDVKDDYLNRLKVGYTNEEATKEVIERNEDFTSDYDDREIFWMALAATQWKYGRLLPEVKKEALKCIQSGRNLERWEDDEKQYEKRKKVLEELEEQLNSPQPPEKRVGRMKLSTPQWDVGDVLLYQIKGEKVKKHRYYGKYALLRVVGIRQCNVGSLPREYSNKLDIVALYNWIGDEEPDIEVIKSLSFMKEKKIGYRLINKETMKYKKNERIVDKMYVLCFDSKKSTPSDFKVIMKDDKYKDEDEYIMDTVGITWTDACNLGFDFVLGLEQVYNKEELVTDIKDESINE